jgi:hypothetical protein
MTTESIVLVALLAIMAAAAFTIAWLSNNSKDKKAIMKAKELREKFALESFVTLLRAAMPELVTAAERRYGGDAGTAKRAYVFSEVLRILPESFAGKLSAARLDEIIDMALRVAKPIWDGHTEALAHETFAEAVEALAEDEATPERTVD